MTIKTPEWRISLLFLFLLLFEFISLFVLSLRNLSYEYLWYDEAGQFWIFKGLNHDSNPMTEENGLSAVIDNNKSYNMDPGGFSIIGHYWTKFSNSIVWLRILPFLFLLGVSTCSAFIFKRLFNNKGITILALMLPFLYPILLNMGFEIRAYSMEVFGSTLLVWCLFRIKDNLSVSNLLVCFVLGAVFMSSRYAEVLVVVVAAIYAAYLVFRSQMNLSGKLLRLLAIGLPVAIGFAVIYLVSLRFQNPELNQLSYLQYLKNRPGLLIRPVNVLYLLSLVIFGAVLFVPRLRLKFGHLEPLLAMCIGANLIFILVSFLGFYPWRIGSKGNLSVNYLFLLSLLALLLEWLRNNVKYHNLAYVSIVAGIGFTMFWGFNGYLLPKKVNSAYPLQDMHCNTPYDFNIIGSPSIRKVFVECWENPYIRYAYEHGHLKDRSKGIYPDKFYLQKGVPHHNFPNRDSILAWRSQVPEMNDLKGYDLVISSELFDWSKKGNDQWHRVEGTVNLWRRNP